MKVTSITVSSGLKVSKNYSSADANVSLTAEVDETEDIEEVHITLKSIVDNMVRNDIETNLEELASL